MNYRKMLENKTENEFVAMLSAMSEEEKYAFWRGLFSEMSEEELIDVFSVALGLLNDEERANMMERCSDIIEAVEARIAVTV